VSLWSGPWWTKQWGDMTHAEQYSTSEPCAPALVGKKSRKRAVSVVVAAGVMGLTGSLLSSTRPASADQISSEKAQAAAIAAKIQATQGQIQALTGQVQAADYRLSQLEAQIAANQAEVTKDQAEVTKDQSQLRAQAISDYTSSGTSNQITQMFSGSPNTSDVRAEYSSIATGNVTTTIDKLHTAQVQLETTQGALKQQQSQAQTTKDSLSSAESQANALVAQDSQTLSSVNASISTLVKQQEDAQAAAAKAAQVAAFNQRVAAAQKAQAAAVASSSSSSSSSGGTSAGDGGGSVTLTAAANPPPVPSGAAGAIQAAESQIGVPYVWGGESPGQGFDCSGLVQWSWARAGVSLPRTSGSQYAATTHISLADIQPGDLLFYGPGGSDHVAMYIGGGEMIEAPQTGSNVHITGVRTSYGFVGVGRVG
jgi:peptidoglycan DL-endopeptidase CwlO